MDKSTEDFFAYAERNILGYKRPADYRERLERVKAKKRYPATEGEKPHKNGSYNEK